MGYHDSSYPCSHFPAGCWYMFLLQDPLQYRPQNRDMWDTRGLQPSQLLHPRLIKVHTHLGASAALASAAHRALGGRVRVDELHSPSPQPHGFLSGLSCTLMPFPQPWVCALSSLPHTAVY